MKAPEQAALEEFDTLEYQYSDDETDRVINLFSCDTVITIRKALADKQWRDISTAEARDNIIVAVRHRNTREWLVGEASLDEDGSWWWANECSGDYRAECIQARHGMPEFYMPLPDAPPSGGEGKNG